MDVHSSVHAHVYSVHTCYEQLKAHKRILLGINVEQKKVKNFSQIPILKSPKPSAKRKQKEHELIDKLFPTAPTINIH